MPESALLPLGYDMTDPTVSIVTPTFNRAGLLLVQWHSLCEQSVPFEWIVVDDASTDSTPSVVQSISDPRIVFARLDDNSGQNAARNAGVRLSRGKYIVFLDSDDYLVTGGLQAAVTAIENAPPTIGAVLMVAVPTYSKKPMAVLPDATVLTEGDLVIKRCLRGDRAIIYKREVFKNQMLPEEYRASEHVFVFGISRWWDYLVVNKPLTLVNRQGEHSSSAANIVLRSDLIARAWETVISNHALLLRNNTPARVSLYMKVLYRYAVGGEWNSLWRVFFELREHDPGCRTAVQAVCVLFAGLLGHLGGEYLRLKFEHWRFSCGGPIG